MKQLMKLLFPCLIITIAIGLAACNGDDATTSKYQYESVENDPLDVRIYTLENGLKVYLSVNKDEPRIQTNIAVRAGSKNDPTDCTGLAHYLEHMVFKGTSKIATTDWEAESELLKQISDLYEVHKATEDTLQKRLIYLQIDSLSQLAGAIAVPNEYDKMISSLGARGTNAYTSTERTVYINNIPSNELEKWLIVESERFSELVLRLFHTELEIVYEEFNRGQDNDYWKASETMDSIMYQKHTYGTQTTIGKGEHLKNPSMVKIHEYFDTYYVPNNMAICIAGDLDPDKTIELIDKYFGHFKPKEVPEFTFEPEDPITSPIIADVQGPMAEWVDIGYRFPGIHAQDRHYLRLISGLLYNRQAGLIDLNLIQKQKVLDADCYFSASHDYSQFALSGNPKQGQSLEEVRELLLEQVEMIKKGEFDDWLLEAIIKDYRMSETMQAESNWVRTYRMLDAFILKREWSDFVNRYDELEKITKQQIVDYASEHFTDNYIVVNKRTGEKKSAYKVPKPKITPIDINREAQSDFYAALDSIPSTRLEPVFVDYENDIKTHELDNGIPFKYIQNTTNDIFSLYYLLDMGTSNDDKLRTAVKYLPYLGTDKYSAEELKKEFFKLGVSFDVFSSEDRIYVYLNGLEESLEQGVALFEQLLANPVADETALKELINDIIKEREDAKKSKWRILYSAMYNYARYGKSSPFTDVLSIEELNALNPEELIGKIKSISNYKHRIFYYGQNDPEMVMGLLNKEHQVPEKLLEYPQPLEYAELETNENKVYYIDYDMVQTEMMMISKAEPFNKGLMPYASLFNEYFGSGLSSIVFQEIREAKALAYSAWASFTTPRRKENAHYVRAYIGTQSDKMQDAVNAMMELMNHMPEAEAQFEDAKLAALKKIETTRITKTRIFWSYENAKRRGLDYDIRKDNYAVIKETGMKELADFFSTHIKGRKYTYLVIGKKSDVDFDALAQLGKVEELSLEEVFGY